MARHLLVVCTANVCRSPIVEGLLHRRLDGVVDVDGQSWVVRSAGTAAGTVRWCDAATRAAATEVGIDVGEHVPRRLDRELLRTDGRDLVVTMTREHLRTVVALDRDAWERTFTLKELARGARRSRDAEPDSFAAWVTLVAGERRAADLLAPAVADDLADPFGGPPAGYSSMAATVERLVEQLVSDGPWRAADGC